MSRPERRFVDGCELVNRAVLAETSGLAEQSLKNLYGDRGRNGHPEGIRIGRGLFFDKEAWSRWHAQWIAGKRSSLTSVDRSGNPDDLLDSREAAAVLGYRNASTIRGYVARDEQESEAYFPEPDEVEELGNGQRRRYWLRSTIWAFADRRSRPGRAGVTGPAAGQKPS